MSNSQPLKSPVCQPVPLEQALLLKRQKALSIGIVLPTLNEEKTIGRILDTWLPLKSRGLVDEIVVIDSGSTDNTAAEVALRQVKFVDAARTLKALALNQYGGKGENMWLGQFQTQADILLIVDSDMENPRPETIINLVSPLLEDDRMMLVKSIFHRDTQNSPVDGLAGGRVTRLAVKPLLQILFPELGDILQPLNGNISIRRSALEQMKIARKYDADLDILLQVAAKYGPSAIGQVNCGSFRQDGQTIDALERMAHQCVRLLFEVARQTGRIGLNGALPEYFTQHLVGGSGMREEKHVYEVAKLPAAITLREYQEGFCGEITFLRHSLTEYNLQKKFQGQVQTAIDPESLVDYLNGPLIRESARPDMIVCSSLDRTYQTARAIRKHLHWKNVPIVVENNLDERNWGELQGKTREEVRWKYPEIDRKVDDYFFLPDGAESVSEVKKRATRAIRKLHSLYAGKKVLCITHAGVLKSLNLQPGDRVKLSALADEPVRD